MAPPRFQLVHLHDIIETTPEGALDVERTREVLCGIADTNAEAGLDLLVDLRGATDTGVSYTDVYGMIGILRENPIAFRGKMALLDSFRPGFEKVQFFEAAATEAGFEVRAFLDFEEATRWLQTTTPLSPPDLDPA